MGSVIKVLDHVERCYSNDDGQKIQTKIKSAFYNDQKVNLSFEGVDGVTSSFINTALIDLLEEFSFDFIKTHLSFSGSNAQINKLINDRFKFEVKKRSELVSC
ncbi:STAS-like domain-containing protein [Bacillus subtilis]|uniref:STAS-like domain-containing protein n=1 Tax=Bacillus subtilis TaxID=1423 RepID=A0AAQ3ID17_BACIU|nr:STAS-like domain-containing protein [Bacillus subtilis]WHM19891.1 STAS-like domain-containing protein [Bacillus subtilis]